MFFVNFAEKTFAVDRLRIFCRRNFCGFGEKNAKNRKTFFRKYFLLLKYQLRIFKVKTSVLASLNLSVYINHKCFGVTNF